MGIKFIDLDMFGIEASLYYESENSKKSKFGALISIFSYLLILYCIIFSLWEGIIRNSILLYCNQTYDPQQSLNITNHPFLLVVTDEYSNPILNIESQYYIFGEYHTIGQNSKVMTRTKYDHNISYFEMEKCRFEKHFGQYLQYFSHIQDIDNYFCLPNDQLTIDLLGSKGDIFNQYAFLKIKVSDCTDYNNSNSTQANALFNSQGCYENVSNDSNLKNIYLKIFYLDYNIDHSNILEPGNLIVKYEAFLISSSLFSRYSINKKKIKYITDLGYFSPNYIEKNYFKDYKIDYYSDLLSINASEAGLLGEIIISLSNHTDYYHRSFIKLQSCIGNIGGFIYVIKIFFSCLFDLLMKNTYFDDMSKNAFRIYEKSELRIPAHSPLKMLMNNQKLIKRDPIENIIEKTEFRKENENLNHRKFLRSKNFYESSNLSSGNVKYKNEPKSFRHIMNSKINVNFKADIPPLTINSSKEINLITFIKKENRNFRIKSIENGNSNLSLKAQAYNKFVLCDFLYFDKTRRDYFFMLKKLIRKELSIENILGVIHLEQNFIKNISELILNSLKIENMDNSANMNDNNFIQIDKYNLDNFEKSRKFPKEKDHSENNLINNYLD